MKVEQLDEIKKDVEEAVKNLLGDKLKKIILYGSYARGDYNEESDIDFAAVAEIDFDKINEFHNDFVKVELDISLKYDIDVSILLFSESHISKYGNLIGIYDSVVKEGRILYGA